MTDRNVTELERKRPQETVEGGAANSPHSVQADSGGGPQLLHIELGLGKSAAIILWISAIISAAAIIGLIAAVMFIRANIAYTGILQYDLMDLRSKMGLTHENTPEGEEP